jgi:hypothetical protein
VIRPQGAIAVIHVDTYIESSGAVNKSDSRELGILAQNVDHNVRVARAKLTCRE